MKKVSILFVSALTLGMVFTSCNKDDDNNSSSPTLEGKWVHSQEGMIMNGQETPLEAYQNDCSTKMDYIELKVNNVANEVYYSSVCEEDVTPATWTRNGNNVTVDYGGGEVMTAEIMTLSATTLKVKIPTSEPTMFGVAVFTRG